MKKILTLRLIESNDKPIVEDIIKDSFNDLDKVINVFKDGYETIRGTFNKRNNLKVIKPIAISDEEIKLKDWYVNLLSYTIEQASNNVVVNWKNNISYNNGTRFLQDDYKKIELLPEHFSDEIKQLIVDGGLKDNDKIEVEFGQDKYSETWGDFIITDIEGKAIIQKVDASTNSFRVGQVVKVISSTSKHYNKIGEVIAINNEVIAVKLNENLTVFYTPEKLRIISTSFKIVSKEELESRRSKAYSYAKFDGDTKAPIMYSEEEVKELFIKYSQEAYRFAVDNLLELAEQMYKEAEAATPDMNDRNFGVGIEVGIDRIIQLIKRQNK